MLDYASLGCRQQLREDREIAAARGGDLKRGAHIDADQMSARPEPQLALAGEQHVPCLVPLRRPTRSWAWTSW